MTRLAKRTYQLLKTVPAGRLVPCHRVVASDGTIGRIVNFKLHYTNVSPERGIV